MKISELLLPEWDVEMATTRNVLARVADKHADWKPHDKSFSMAHLAQLVATMPGWVKSTLDDDSRDIAPKDGPTNVYRNQPIASLLEQFDKCSREGRDVIARTSDEQFQKPWTLLAAGVAQFTQPRYNVLRGMVINHLAHHRAQLGLYLRMVGAAVPDMYGPTADTKQQQKKP